MSIINCRKQIRKLEKLILHQFQQTNLGYHLNTFSCSPCATEKTFLGKKVTGGKKNYENPIRKKIVVAVRITFKMSNLMD